MIQRLGTGDKEDKKPTFIPLGDQILIVQFEDILSLENNKKVQQFANAIKNANINGITSIITAMTNISIKYNPFIIHFNQLEKKLKSLPKMNNEKNECKKKIYIPVTFDEKYGLDLPAISDRTDLTKENIIHIICSNIYYVYMIGFIAGLPYMGDIDKRIHLPRKANPRVTVPKGSVAIANQMTDIYTVESPGGWHIIGWTPMDLFNIRKDPPNRLSPGDYVKYEPISKHTAENWNEQKQKEWDEIWNL